MPKIQFLPHNIIFDIDEDKTLLENALSQGIPQARACGGHGKCSTCRVWVMEGVENCLERTPEEKEMALKLNFSEVPSNDSEVVKKQIDKNGTSPYIFLLTLLLSVSLLLQYFFLPSVLSYSAFLS